MVTNYISVLKLLSVHLRSSDINKISVQLLTKYLCGECSANVLSGFQAHPLCPPRIINQLGHSIRELQGSRGTEKPCDPILDRLDRPTTIAGNDRLVRCHSLQGNNTEMFILHSVNCQLIRFMTKSKK